MQSNDEKRQKVQEIIVAKWPTTKESGEADLLATWILTADQFLPMELGKFVDQPKFRELAPALRVICRVLPEISQQGRFELEFHANLLTHSSDREDPLVEFTDHAQRFLAAVEYTLKTKGDLDPPHGKTNWRAVSVFEACVQIWEAQEGQRPPKMNAGSQHTAPFGLFVKGIYDALGIGWEPRSAQDRLAAWQKEQS